MIRYGKGKTIANTTDYKLSREQFADAVSKGLGRAMIYVQRYGLDDVADILLDACIHNKVYDTQIESGRASWLYAMFSNSPQYNNFRDAILSSLKKENELDDAGQLCEFAKEMALDGDMYARTTLRDFALKAAETGGSIDLCVAKIYIKVGGNEAVLELARIYGQKLLDNPEEHVNDSLSYEDKELEVYKHLLKEHSYSDPRIKIYFDYLEDKGAFEPVEVLSDIDRAIRRENRRMEFLSQYNTERIIDLAKNDKKENHLIFQRFGLLSETKDLEVIFAELLKTENDRIRSRLLRVFSSIPLPVIHPRLFEWAESNYEELQVSVFSAFANCKDDRVHDFARQRVKDSKITGRGNSFILEVFEKNFENNDAKLITNAILTSKLDRADAHHLGRSIIGITKNHKTNELKELLLWVYENTPCSFCREGAVTRLNEIGALSQEIIDECKCDGNEDIRKFVSDLVK